MKNITKRIFNSLAKPDTQKIEHLEGLFDFPRNKELSKMEFFSFVKLILKYNPELFNEPRLFAAIDKGLENNFLDKIEFEKLTLKFAGKIPKLKKYIRPELYGKIRKDNFISKVKDTYHKSMLENRDIYQTVKNGIKHDISEIVDIVKTPFYSLEKKNNELLK